MKKTIIYFVLLAGIAASFSSCFSFFFSHSSGKTHKMTVDESVPSEQTVKVTFDNNLQTGWFEVKEWNNERNSKKIGETLYGKDGVWSDQKTQLTVPAGNSNFIFDARYTFSRGRSSIEYPFKGVELRYNLEQGKEYRVNGIIRRIDSSNRYELFIAIFDVTGKEELLLKEWKLGETK